MRELMKRFDEKKFNFSNSSGPIKLDLPEELSSINVPKYVKDGELTIAP